MNNKIESLKKELKDAYVDGYVAETYAAQDAREDLLSFTNYQSAGITSIFLFMNFRHIPTSG